MIECTIPDVYRWSEPIARKQYKCCECRALILKGEKHFQCFGVWEGDASTYRQHLLCAEASMLIRDLFNGGECIGFGCLKESLGEMRWQMDKKSPHGNNFGM